MTPKMIIALCDMGIRIIEWGQAKALDSADEDRAWFEQTLTELREVKATAEKLRGAE